MDVKLSRNDTDINFYEAARFDKLQRPTNVGQRDCTVNVYI
jgi:hypothetical protein